MGSDKENKRNFFSLSHSINWSKLRNLKNKKINLPSQQRRSSPSGVTAYFKGLANLKKKDWLVLKRQIWGFKKDDFQLIGFI